MKARRFCRLFAAAILLGAAAEAGAETRIAVTNLLSSGKGSLHDCLEQSGSRVCEFQIAGEIPLEKNLVIRSPQVRVAGSTAPAPGIRLRRAGVIVEASDVALENFEIRIGDTWPGPKAEDRDALRIGGGQQEVQRVTVDHLSLSWGIDENLSIVGPARDIKVTNCLIAQGLANSIHPKGEHSKGMMIGENARNILVRGNLLAFHTERNPYVKPDTSLQFINNVVYGWGARSQSGLFNISDSGRTGRGVEVDFVGNVYAPSSFSTRFPPIFAKPPASISRIFVADNIGPTGPAADWQIAAMPEFPYRRLTPHFASTLTEATPAKQVFQNVLQSAGSRPMQRNSFDAQVVALVRSGRGFVPDCVTGCGKAAVE